MAELGRDDGPRWRLLASAPLAAAAFYVRYGSIQLLVAIGAVLAVAFRRAILRRPLPVVGTAALFAALLAPHLVAAADATGSPLGVLRASAAATTQDYLGDGLVWYAKTWPWRLFGVVGGAVTAIGLFDGARAAWRRDPADRDAIILWAIAVIDMIWVGLSAHGERRYMFPALVLFALLGSRAAVRWWRTRPRSPIAMRVAIAALGLAAAASFVQARLIVRTSDGFSRIHTAVAARLRADARGESCAVLGSATPHLAWYARCATAPVGKDPAAALARLPGAHRYLVLLATAPRREPPPAMKDQLRALLAADLLARVPDASSRHNDAEIYRADTLAPP
jgi:hypothetical protein